MTSRKVALVTGTGRRRVGWFVAEALAGQGYALVLNYRTPGPDTADAPEHFRARGVEAVTHRADLADETAVRGLVRAALDHFGRLDVLVNCAAVWQSRPLEDVTAADVRRHFEANVLGTFLCGREAGLAMVKQAEGGCVVNFGDWAEARPYPDYAAYFASKGAVSALTRCLAVELGTRNPRVRVNAILPGPVLFQPDLPAAEQEGAAQTTLVRQAGRPDSVAQAVLALVANDFITGVCLPVDGGRSVYAGGR